jgi:hypothetical protein
MIKIDLGKGLLKALIPVLIAISSQAQNNNNLTITGKVFDDKTGVGLPGASTSQEHHP